MLENYLNNLDFGEFKIIINKFRISSNMELNCILTRQRKKIFQAIWEEKDILISIDYLRRGKNDYCFQINVIKSGDWTNKYILIFCQNDLFLLRQILQFMLNLIIDKDGV